MHDLIKDNQIIKEHDFGSDTPPILHTNKGVWMLRTTINPDYDPEIQTKTLTKTINGDSTTWTYTVTNKTQGELESDFNEAAASKYSEPIPVAIMKALQLTQLPADTSGVELDNYASLFPAFMVGESIGVGDKRQYADVVWTVIQAHTTQMDWLPPDVPALWKRVYNPDVILPWEQRGAENPYMTNDKVTFEGHTWESIIDTNTWSPTSYPAGWNDLGLG